MMDFISNVWQDRPTIVALSLALLWVLLVRLNKKQKYLPLPPGPPKLPILGNALDIPMSKVTRTYKKWCEEYNSDVIHLTALHMNIVVLGSYEACIDLCEKRSSMYSSRPNLVMVNELMGWGWSLPQNPYGEAWRIKRRMFHKTFNEEAAKAFRPQQTASAQKLLVHLLATPAKFSDHISHSVAQTIVSVAYGFDVQPENDPFVHLMETAVQTVVAAAVPGKYLVDIFPILRHVPAWFPGANFQREAAISQKLSSDLKYLPFNNAKRLIEKGEGRTSFTSLNLADTPKDDVATHEKYVAETAGAMYSAGVDTTANTILTALLGIVMQPHVLKTAQEELDRVVRPGHLPMLDDKESLPYLMAIIMEATRWNPVAHFGVPRYLETEDVYRGFRIPKGSIVIQNIFGIMRDEKIYPDPETFNPDRFMKNGQIDKSILNPLDVVFGFGRRICPGMHVAQTGLWISLASILLCFNVTAIPGEPAPSGEFNEGLIRTPKPFKCDIKPRSREAAELIRMTALQEY